MATDDDDDAAAVPAAAATAADADDFLFINNVMVHVQCWAPPSTATPGIVWRCVALGCFAAWGRGTPQSRQFRRHA